MEHTIALTGATGFIGNRIARRLVANGCKLQALTRTTSDRSRLSGLNIHWVEGALEDLDSLKLLVRGVNAVVHCAGTVRGATQAHFDRSNVDGVARLVQAVMLPVNDRVNWFLPPKAERFPGRCSDRRPCMVPEIAKCFL
jgi:nucleoside-diphosphate-sugar epimerase